MNSLPGGTITFLFTDIEGSTKRWDAYGGSMGGVIARHDALLRQAIEASGGYVFKTIGDAFCAAFSTATSALAAALAIQRAIADEPWADEVGGIRVRIALHTGAAEEREGDYFGPVLNRVARLLSAGHGEQILLSLPSYELVRDALPAEISLKEMGEHRLKDLSRPERVFQVMAPGLPGDFPPLKTLDNRPNNLPMQVTPFIGREKPLTEVTERLRGSLVRLLTLTGAGGAGKTRLALQAAADLLDDFPDGVFFVNLAPLTDHALVISTVAGTLGVREGGGQPIAETLKEYLQEKRLLLLLDNFEQVAEAASQVGALLAGCPQLKVLATSRAPLNVRAEHEYAVPALTLPDPGKLPSLEKLTQYEAVRLFIERAQSVKSDFEVTNQNAPAVAEICVRLDGLPLAIELAAARIKLLPPQAMLPRLQSKLKLLTGGARDLPARQQTLRGAIEWSYDLLDDGEKQLFIRLSVFEGGRTLEAIDAICNATGDLRVDSLDGVESLVSKNLMQQQELEGGEPRFVLLETIHEYAREKLEESGEGEALRRQHALYFLALAEQAKPHLEGTEQNLWMNRLEEEHANLRAALEWAKREPAPEVGLRLVVAFYNFWKVRGYISEGRTWMSDMLTLGAHLMIPERVDILNYASGLASIQNDYALALSFTEEALALSKELGYKVGTIDALYSLQTLVELRGDYDAGVALAEEQMALARELGNKELIEGALWSLAYAHQLTGDLERAKELFEEILLSHRERGNKGQIASILVDLGNIANIQEDYPSARRHLEEALTLFREGKRKRGTAVCLLALGCVKLYQAEYIEARTIFEEGLLLSEDIGDSYLVSDAVFGLAGIWAARGELPKAVRLLSAARGWQQAANIAMEPIDLKLFRSVEAQVRPTLEESNFATAWTEGQVMTLAQAVVYALEK